jgi:hypothetical protein
VEREREREGGKITFGKLNKNLGLGAKIIPSWCNKLVNLMGADFKVDDKFMTLFVIRRDVVVKLAPKLGSETIHG